MNDKEKLELMERISCGIASDEELGQYNAWCNAMQEPGLRVSDFDSLKTRMMDNINHKIDHPRIIRLRYYKIAVSAAAMVAVVFGLWFFRTSALFAHDVLPGKNTATIVFANGKRIQLSEAKNGVVIDVSSLKYNDGSAVAGPDDMNQTGMLTTVTPRGGTYQVTLPDGTHVWMNADSKVMFPARFSGRNREISLEGEAYFEVTKDKEHPFIVKSRLQRIEVLGTHFNVNSYTDEEGVKTTLLEGSVRVLSQTGKGIVLKPGEEAINTGEIDVEKADTTEAVAWKNGNVVFKAKSLESIMRELSRWYDVTVVYAADAPKDVTFSGAVSRTRNISSVLERMQTTGSVKFKIEGKTITVTR